MARLSSLYNKNNGERRLSPRGRAAAMLVGLMALGSAFSIFNVPLASSAANSIEVVRIAEAVPLAAGSQLWDRAKEAEIPLSAQQIYQPGGGSTRFVRVKALEDGHSISFQVSWDDDTRNDTIGNIPSDAAAIQLPIEPSHLPYQCMGQSSSKVNIWQWKAALEKQGLEELGSNAGSANNNPGIRNLTSNGICKAVDTPGIDPEAHSFHDGKMWHVIFTRALSKGDLGTAPLVEGTNSAIAFAVWNGARGEARGMKAVSTWNTLMFPAPNGSNVGNLLTLGFVVLVSAGVVAYSMRRFGAA
ncbi:MAG: ethylbenzene dehydrogenase-related protein [Chloroflexota bacterium]|nr:ethylbenzene dehydrogenase-related protein [Chloroflexota bacterium]